MKENELDGVCGMDGGEESCAQGLVGKPEGKRLLGKPSRRYEDDITIGLTEICWDCVDLVDMLEDGDT